MTSSAPKVKATALLCFCAGAAQSIAAPPSHTLRPSPEARPILPVRLAAARAEADGTFRLLSGWTPYTPSVTRDTSLTSVFDGLEVDSTGAPQDGVYSPDCGMGSARWSFGPGYSDPNVVNDIEHLADPLYNGTAVDHVSFMVYSDGNGVDPTEPLFVAVATYDSFGQGCTPPAASGFRNAVVYDFGPQPTPGTMLANIDLRGTGLFHLMPASGSGAFSISLFKAYDAQTGTGSPSTSAHTLLWGTKPTNPSAQRPAQWDDDAPTDGAFDELECYDLGFGLCPDPLGAAVFFGRHAPAQDCNLNGIDDFLDIAAGTSPDADTNGRPDECDGVVSLTQLSFRDLDGNVYAPYTSCAELGFTYVEPGRNQVQWLNAVVGGRWVVQNAPIVEVNGEGQVHTYSMAFDGAGAEGEPLPPQPVVVAVTAERQEAPPAGPAQVVPVLERQEFRGGVQIGDAPPSAAPVPDPPANFENGVTRGTWNVVARRDVPGVSEEKNHCLVGATARSLAWLDQTYKCQFPGHLDTATELYDALKGQVFMNTSTTTGTQIRLEDGALTYRNRAVEGITKFRNNTPHMATRFSITDKTFVPSLPGKQVKNPIEKPPTPSDLFKDLGTGQSIVLIFAHIDSDGNYAGGHAVTVVGAVQEILQGSDAGTVKILYRDDNQGDGEPDTVAETKTTYLVPRTDPDGWRLQGGVNSQNNLWLGYIMFCPSLAQRVEGAREWGRRVHGIVKPRVLEGQVPPPSDRKKVREGSYRIEDQADSMLAELHRGAPPCSAAEPPALDFRQLAATLSLQSKALDTSPTLENAQAVLDTLDQLDPVLVDLGAAAEVCDCRADYNRDGLLDAFDYDDFVNDFFSVLAGDDGFPDYNGDAYFDAFDYDDFVSDFFTGC